MSGSHPTVPAESISFERRGFVLGLVKDFDAAGLHPFAPELVALKL